MKMFKLFPIAVVILITFFSCSSNKKLNQDSAEKTIKEFVRTHSLNTDYCQFDLASIESIGNVNQFSDTEAYVISVIGQQKFQFTFKKNIDKKWILMSISAPEHMNMGTYKNLVEPNQNIGMVAQ